MGWHRDILLGKLIHLFAYNAGKISNVSYHIWPIDYLPFLSSCSRIGFHLCVHGRLLKVFYVNYEFTSHNHRFAKLSIVELLFIQVLRQLKLKLMVFKFSVYISSNFISVTRGVLPRNIFFLQFSVSMLWPHWTGLY